MESLPWTPWQHVVALRDDLRTGELSLPSFIADLYTENMRCYKGQPPFCIYAQSVVTL